MNHRLLPALFFGCPSVFLLHFRPCWAFLVGSHAGEVRWGVVLLNLACNVFWYDTTLSLELSSWTSTSAPTTSTGGFSYRGSNPAWAAGRPGEFLEGRASVGNLDTGNNVTISAWYSKFWC